MNVICKPRCSGKTYYLIMESAKTGHPIITATSNRSKYINEEAKRMGVRIKEAISIREYEIFKSNGSLFTSPSWTGKLLIDDVDLVLNGLLNADVVTATCTPDNMNNNHFMEEIENMKNEKTETINLIDVAISKNNYNINTKEPNFVVKDSEYNLPRITDVNIIVPNKVVEVIFSDGTKEKSVCREPDVFNFEQAIGICISKKIMGGSSAYNNAVKRGIKVYEENIRKERKDKEEQERIEKKRAKRKAYKERRAAKREQEEKEKQIEIQKEAYIRAMIEVENMKNKCA